MTLFLAGIGIVLLGGFGALVAGLLGRRGSAVAAGGAVVGGLLAVAPALAVLLGRPVESLHLPWSMPGGAFRLSLDPLSAVFLLPTLLLSALAAVYGVEYLDSCRSPRRLGVAWCAFDLLAASMALVLTAGNGLLFLLAWEVMALASFVLVVFEHEKREVRRAGWTYLVATHLGTAALLAMLALMGGAAGSFDFAEFARVAASQAGLPDLLFVLALIGFGTKAGFMPLHIWLPEAHPAAPSHVSAVMSGVMIKTGIYGLVRLLTLLPHPPAWWGWLLVGIGVTSGVLGVLFALAQHDLKRLLAYSSVENIGIISLALGLGLLGVASGMPALAVLGFAGGLLHVLNHALFKGLLFLGAGAVLHGAGTRELDQLGGLLRRMPRTGVGFLMGAVAISGLPPLNGFVGEFLIYAGAFRGTLEAGGRVPTVVSTLLAIGALALIGGLAAACFTRAFGIVFLGEPRTEQAAGAHEVGPAMRWPMAILAAACAAVGLCPAGALALLAPAIRLVARQPELLLAAVLTDAGRVLWMLALGALGVLACLLLLAALRRRLLAGRRVEATVTWDCGYARPSARMQYTASSFAQPLTALFHLVLRTRVRLAAPAGLFPPHGAFATETLDTFREGLFRPAFAGLEWLLGRLRLLQHGRIQLYVLYIVLTLIALMAWRLP
jgi:formate hydrogenlyase subunit 3/multisubunit Na+/H+ antiporter MnhD subunit